MNREIVSLQGKPDVNAHFFRRLLTPVDAVVVRRDVGAHQYVIEEALVAELLDDILVISLALGFGFDVANAETPAEVMCLDDLAQPRVRLLELGFLVLNEAVETTQVKPCLTPPSSPPLSCRRRWPRSMRRSRRARSVAACAGWSWRPSGPETASAACR